MTRSISLVLSVVLASPPATDVPEAPPEMTDPAARAHFDAGWRAWFADDHATAQREFEAAYAIEAEPKLLYTLGRLARAQGRCDLARERFLAFLATNPGPNAVEDTNANLERCGGVVVVQPPPVEPPPPQPTVPPPDSPPPKPRKPDALGISLTAIGSAAVVAGLGVFGGSFAEQQRANAQSDLGSFDRRVRTAKIEYATGLAVASVGVALLIGGIVRLAIARRRDRARAAKRRSP